MRNNNFSPQFSTPETNSNQPQKQIPTNNRTAVKMSTGQSGFVGSDSPAPHAASRIESRSTDGFPGARFASR